MNNSQTQISRSYQQEDIQQILNIAIAHQANDGEFTRDQLVEIATELGISTATLQEAEQQWLIKQKEGLKRQEFNLVRRKKLQKRAGKYVIINGFFMGINFLSAGEVSWSLYILLFWGLGLGLDAWNTYQLQGEEHEQAFRKWYRKHQIAESITSRINNWMKAM
ncbi:MAG: 2TM domain-containing protein [Coleofasciculaceae cyanobacterium]